MKTTQDLAREAGIQVAYEYKNEYKDEYKDGDIEWCCFTKNLKAFEALVRADERKRIWTQEHWTEYERSIADQEREACAKVCESEWLTTQQHTYGLVLADIIRNRGNT
jgi:hypothetical protein